MVSGAVGTRTVDPIPLVDLVVQHRQLKGEIQQALEEIFASGRFILGEKGREFEEAVARLCGCRCAVGVASGSDALLLALQACGIGRGDQVITTPLTFIATVEAIIRVGATPVFADINLTTYTIDPEHIERLITKKTKAILPVHLYGHPADLGAIMRVARRHHLRVIEDAAQAFGARYAENGQARWVGTVGDVGCLSFFPSKVVGACGDAGMALTNDRGLAERLRRLRVHGSTTGRYQEPGVNSRLDEIQAAILSVKLRHLEAWIERRRHHAARYSAALSRYCEVPHEEPFARHCYSIYTIRCRRRNALKAWLATQGIQTEIYYPLPLHLQPVYRSLGYRRGDLPASEQVAREALSLPVYPELTESERERVAEAICEFLAR